MTRAMEAGSGAAEGILVDELADWLMAKALGECTVHDLYLGCCTRLHAADVSISRATIGFRTLHPLFRAVTLLWRRGESIQVTEHPHGPVTEAFKQGPHFRMIEQDIPLLRRRLEGESATLDFPVLRELRESGATDYLAFLIPFDDPHDDPFARDGIIGSWATDRPGGFSDVEIRILRRIQRRLGVACKVSIKEQIARNILDAYLGHHTGQRVYRGDIERGSGEPIHAVIWFSDLRGSTALSRRMPMEAFLGVLNEFFEAMADSVLDRGGEVLRFMGDAVLAIFPMEVHDVVDPRTCPIHRRACATALAAARDAIARMKARNARRANEGEERLGFGIALHVGDVMYGNIGVPRRVEFSVIGHAANQAAKMESLCKVLEVPLLVSPDFAGIHPADWVDLGEHPIGGGDVPGRVLTLAEVMHRAEPLGGPPRDRS